MLTLASQWNQLGRSRRRSARGKGALVTAFLVALASIGLTGSAGAAQQVFDVDETQSTFTSGSITVNFDVIANSDGLLGAQFTTGSATVMNPGYAADGTVTLDTQTGEVTLEDLSIGGLVGQSGTGQMVWANLLTLNLVYNIVEQGLELNAPLTMPLAGGAFSGTPNFEFTGVSDGAVTGIISYGIGAEPFSSSGDLPLSGTLSQAGGDTILDISANQMLIDLGSSPTVVTDVNECAVTFIGCLFFVTTVEITVTSLVYNDVQMTLVGTAPSLGEVCGDGNVDAGEACDDGNTVGGDGCSATCEIEACGNSVVDVGETCDDGNTVGGDGCSDTCQAEACGNDVVDVGETCDDGNTAGGDGCSAVCQLEVCGNAVLDPGEACDDGNTMGGDGCSAICAVEACGNSIVDVGESCDDGNAIGGDGCSETCQLESCGNGVIDSGEGCDDGNVDDGDGCSAVCQPEVCGNGVLDPGEVCDDGNTADEDGCSSTCEIEILVPGVGPWGAFALGLLLLAAGGLMLPSRGDDLA